MKNYILSLIPCILLASCQLNSKYLYEAKQRDMPGYVTPVANVNVQKEKGQLQNTSFVGLTHVENQFCYNTSRRVFAQGETYLSGSVKYGSLGVGNYIAFAKGRILFTPSIGYGFGTMNYTGIRQYSSERGILNWGGRETIYGTRIISTKSKLMKLYQQVNLTFFSKNNRHSFSLGARMNIVAFLHYEYHVSAYNTTHYGLRQQQSKPGMAGTSENINSYGGIVAPVLDSYLTYTAKVRDHIGVYFQALLNTPLRKKDQQNKSHLINDPNYPLLSAGLLFTLGPKKKM
jgi:hypothetical protein